MESYHLESEQSITTSHVLMFSFNCSIVICVSDHFPAMDLKFSMYGVIMRLFIFAALGLTVWVFVAPLGSKYF